MNRLTYLYVLIVGASAVVEEAAAQGCGSHANASAHIDDEVALLQTKLALVQHHATNSSAENSLCIGCAGGDEEERRTCFRVAPNNQCSNAINAGGVCHQYAYYIGGERKRCYNGVRESTLCRPHSSIHEDTEFCPNRYLEYDDRNQRLHWEITQDTGANAHPYTRYVVGSSPLPLGIIDIHCGPTGGWTAAMARIVVDTFDAIWAKFYVEDNLHVDDPAHVAPKPLLPAEMLDHLQQALDSARDDLPQAVADRALKAAHPGPSLEQHFIQEHHNEVDALRDRLHEAVAAGNDEALGGFTDIAGRMAFKLPNVDKIRGAEQVIIDTPDATYQQWIQEYRDKIPVYTAMLQDLGVAATNGRDDTVFANYRWNQWKEICTMYKL